MYSGLPWAGPVWAVEASSIYKTFKKWSEKFGSLYEVTLFGQNLIIISDPAVAQEILAKKAKTVSDRPPLALVKGSKDSGKYLPFLGNNGNLYASFCRHMLTFNDRAFDKTEKIWRLDQ